VNNDATYFPPYVDLARIEAAANGEEEGLRIELERLRADKAEARRELMDLRQRGTLWLVLTYIANRWFDSLRRNHTWGSVFATPREDLLVVTRPQRVLILTSSCLASMAVNALFFGSEADRISARFLGALISAACMVPIERITPHLFGFVNTFRSDTLDISYAVRQKRRDELEKRRKALLGPNHGLHGQHRSGVTAPAPEPMATAASPAADAKSEVFDEGTQRRPDGKSLTVRPNDVSAIDVRSPSSPVNSGFGADTMDGSVGLGAGGRDADAAGEWIAVDPATGGASKLVRTAGSKPKRAKRRRASMLFVALQREEATEGGRTFSRQMESDHVTTAAAEAADDVTGAGFVEIIESLQVKLQGTSEELGLVPAPISGPATDNVSTGAAHHEPTDTAGTPPSRTGALHGEAGASAGQLNGHTKEAERDTNSSGGKEGNIIAGADNDSAADSDGGWRPFSSAATEGQPREHDSSARIRAIHLRTAAHDACRAMRLIPAQGGQGTTEMEMHGIIVRAVSQGISRTSIDRFVT